MFLGTFPEKTTEGASDDQDDCRVMHLRVDGEHGMHSYPQDQS